CRTTWPGTSTSGRAPGRGRATAAELKRSARPLARDLLGRWAIAPAPRIPGIAPAPRIAGITAAPWIARREHGDLPAELRGAAGPGHRQGRGVRARCRERVVDVLPARAPTVAERPRPRGDRAGGVVGERHRQGR